MGDEPADYGLIMPFVVCGDDGAYDDASFVAGWAMAKLDTLLSLDAVARAHGCGLGDVVQYVRTASLPQADLIAMRYGFVMAAEPWIEDAEWSRVEFTTAADDAEEG